MNIYLILAIAVCIILLTVYILLRATYREYRNLKERERIGKESQDSVDAITEACTGIEQNAELLEDLSVAMDTVKTITDHKRVAEEVRKIIHASSGIVIDDSNTDANLKDLGIDSIATLELCMAAEDKFDIEITDAEWDQCVTADRIINLLSLKLGY